MAFKEKLESRTFVVVAELQPPKGTDLSELLDHADRLKGRVSAVNVPDLQNAILRMGSLPVCALLKARGIEPILNLACSNRNRLALQSDLLSTSSLGIENVLLLQGDSPSVGDHFEARPVFDLDLMGLLRAVKRLQEGTDLMGNELHGKPTFWVGAQVNTAARGQDLETEVRGMEEKMKEGVNFFLTTPVYDADLFEVFSKKVAALKVPLIAGVTLLKSVGMARYINKHVEGASIPETAINQLMKASDKQQAGVEIASNLIKALRPLCQGVQIIPIGWERCIPAVLDRAGL
jgi:methylenetetrahydrofolate reductase (NADPH)